MMQIHKHPIPEEKSTITSGIAQRQSISHTNISTENPGKTVEDHRQAINDTIPALAWSARPDGSADFFNR